jgi:hypothetical protein
VQTQHSIFTGTSRHGKVFSSASKILVTGNPVRKNIVQHQYTKTAAITD